MTRIFDTWLDDFFDHYYRRRPVNATFIGVHEFDHTLPDYTANGIAASAVEMRELLTRLDSIPAHDLDLTRQHDRQIASGFLEIQLWEIDSWLFQRGNPSCYTGEAVFSVISLFQRDSNPLADRVAAAISRMKLIPEFLATARTNVQSAHPWWTETALREASSAESYFREGIPILAADREITDPEFQAAAVVAADAFTVHTKWLAETLMTQSNENYSSGRDAFERYLHKGHCLPIEQDAVSVESYAREQLAAALNSLDAYAKELDPTRTWQDQLPDLQDLHPTIDNYYSEFPRVWESARASAIENDLVTWPDYPIEYVPVPRSDRSAAPGLYYLWYRCPPPFGKPEVHHYLVTPIEPEMPSDEIERRLRGSNDCQIKLNHVVHHGGLGHHVQNWHAFRSESRVGRMAGVDCASRIAMSGSGTMVEGWACYATDLMAEVGFLTPLEMLAERHSRVRMCCRAVVDCALHTGQMTLEQAAAFYESEAAMPASAAKGEAIKNSMNPGAAMMYLIGTDAIHTLRAEMSEREGSDFSLRAFHDRFLSYGAIPVSLIRDAMLSV